MNMSGRETVIPPPSAVREKLAENLREARVLRRQYRLSMDVYAEPRREQAPANSSAATATLEVAR
jgi:hypothetical protein